ncbi:MAG: amidase domain-containing protein [Lachnospiraceae bacterium]
MKKSVLVTIAIAATISPVLGFTASATNTDEKSGYTDNIAVYEKLSLSTEEKSQCASPRLTNIGQITNNKYVNINGENNLLYCTFSNQQQALENIKSEASDLLDILSTKYNLLPLNGSNWMEYREKMYDLFTIPTDELNESNEDFVKLRIFFDIYENKDSNDQIMKYISEKKLNTKSGISAAKNTDIVELGLLFPYYAPIAQQAENIIVPISAKVSINVTPAVNYAAAHATNRNTPTYYSFGSDCTNFASQILEASGVRQVVYTSEFSGWWHKKNGSTHTHSRSWTVADVFSRYMGITYKTKNNASFSSVIKQGDFIAGDWSSDGSWDHTAFVTGKDPKAMAWGTNQAYYNYKVAQHTGDYHLWTNHSQNRWERTGTDGGTFARVR